MGKRSERNTKGKIASAAWTLFTEKGYDNTTIEDIIEASGTSRGSFYHYFEGKDSLIASMTFVLDEEYQKAVLAGERDTILFADRFPFRYLTDDYDLNYYAAFAGCSAETEASFETILFLAGKADELELPVILTIDGSDQTIAEAVINSTNAKDQKILSMNSMQSITAGDMEDGASYLSVMEENLEVLKEALS